MLFLSKYLIKMLNSQFKMGYKHMSFEKLISTICLHDEFKTKKNNNDSYDVIFKNSDQATAFKEKMQALLPAEETMPLNPIPLRVTVNRTHFNSILFKVVCHVLSRHQESLSWHHGMFSSVRNENSLMLTRILKTVVPIITKELAKNGIQPMPIPLFDDPTSDYVTLGIPHSSKKSGICDWPRFVIAAEVADPLATTLISRLRLEYEETLKMINNIMLDLGEGMTRIERCDPMELHTIYVDGGMSPIDLIRKIKVKYGYDAEISDDNPQGVEIYIHEFYVSYQKAMTKELHNRLPHMPEALIYMTASYTAFGLFKVESAASSDAPRVTKPTPAR